MSEPESATRTQRGRGRPPRLSRAAILSAAVELIDRHGAGALTMRRLGAEIGFEAMSLYRHIANKDALLDGIAETLMEEIRIETDSDDWPSAVRRFADGVRQVARRHPGAFRLVALRSLNTPAAVRPIEALLAAMRAGGFSASEAVAGWRVVASYARGYALLEIDGFTLSASRRDHSRLSPDKLPPDEFPVIRDYARELIAEPTDAQFAAGVEVIVAGLRARLEQSRP